ncbi:hypothetical protein, partial [Klebsiella variicola]|uniref:hypothetical protein n=1 Tax=Klebsiella variicola TaxID=244366 RepID=UPI0015D4787B
MNINRDTQVKKTNHAGPINAIPPVLWMQAAIITLGAFAMKWFTEFGHLNRGDMLTSEQHRCHNEKKKFQ